MTWRFWWVRGPCVCAEITDRESQLPYWSHMTAGAKYLQDAKEAGAEWGVKNERHAVTLLVNAHFVCHMCFPYNPKSGHNRSLEYRKGDDDHIVPRALDNRLQRAKYICVDVTIGEACSWKDLCRHLQRKINARSVAGTLSIIVNW